MIGNDIVALKAWGKLFVDRKDRRIRKIFTPEERLWLKQQSDQVAASALLWSMKEAAYKSVTRKDLNRKYNPLKFNCEMEKEQAYVNFNNLRIKVETHVCEEYANAFVYEGEGLVQQHIFETTASDKKQASDQALEFFYKLVESNSVRFEIIKINKIPFLKTDGYLKNMTISHHHNFHYYCYEVQ